MDLIYAILNLSIPNIVAKVQKIHKNFHFQRILNLSKQPVIYDTTNFPCKMTSEKPVQFSKRNKVEPDLRLIDLMTQESLQVPWSR